MLCSSRHHRATVHSSAGPDIYVTYATPGGDRTPVQGAVRFVLAQVGKPYGQVLTS